MKNFKKFLALMLVLAMSVSLVFAFSSCSNDAGESSGDSESGDGGSGSNSKSGEPIADEAVLDYVKGEVSDGVSESVKSLYTVLKNSAGSSATGVSGEINVEIGDKLLDYLEQMLSSESGMNLSLEGFEKLGISMDMASKDSLSQLAMALLIGNTSIVSAEMVMDTDGEEMYVRVPELNQKWLNVPVDMSENGGMAAFDIDRLQEIINALPSEEVLVSLVDKYMTLVWDNVKKSEIEAHTLTVGSTSEEVRRLTVIIDEETICNVCAAVLDEFLKDETLEAEAKSFMSALYSSLYSSENYMGADFDSMWSETWSELEYEAQETLSEAQELLSSGEYSTEAIPFVVYINNKNELCGAEFEHEGVKYVEWATVQQDGKFEETITVRGGNSVSYESAVDDYYYEDYTETSQITELFSIYGSGTMSSSVNGVFTITVEGTTVGTLEYINVARDGSRGKINLKLSESMLSDMLGYSWSEVENEFGVPYIQIEYSNANKKSEMSLRLMTGDELLVGIGISGEQKSGAVNISKPSSSNVYGADEMESWAQGISFNKILSNINKTGISQDIKDMINSVLSMASENL